MNPRSIVTLTNRIAMIAIGLLIYWVFIFMSITVFGLKVFRQNMTETFAMSIMGIISLLAGAVIVNIMYNLTRIANAVEEAEQVPAASFNRKKVVAMALSFPIIFALLVGGDMLSTRKRKINITGAADVMVKENQDVVKRLADYRFSKDYRKMAEESISLLEKMDKNFPRVMVILEDEIQGKKVFVAFDRYNHSKEKKAYIYAVNVKEREYLRKVFAGKYHEQRFTAHDGNYELYHPYTTVDGKIIVLYLSDRKRYGKIGS